MIFLLIYVYIHMYPYGYGSQFFYIFSLPLVLTFLNYLCDKMLRSLFSPFPLFFFADEDDVLGIDVSFHELG